MWRQRKRQLHTIVGRSGSGKTALLRYLASQSPRALIFDCFGNFDHGVIINSQSDLWDYLNQCLDRFRILYRPRIDITERERLKNEINFLCRISRAIQSCDLFLDELDTFADATDLPTELDTLIRYGRNIEISLHAAVRRPKAVIPKHYVTETTHWSIFRICDPGDGAYLADYTGIDRALMSQLADLRFVDWIEGDQTCYSIRILPDGMVEVRQCQGF